MENRSIYWKGIWGEKASLEDEFAALGRKSYTLREFLILTKEVQEKLKLDKNDVLLDVGCGGGVLTAALAPWVRSIDSIDYSNAMIERAKKWEDYFKNIRFRQGNLLNLTDIFKKDSFTKLLVFSVLQYLNNYEDVRKSLKEINRVLNDRGIAFIGHNPDIEKRGAHLKSYEKLNLPKEELDRAMELEDKRLWLDFAVIEDIAKEEGFKSCSRAEIDSNLFQSTHMFDFVLIK